MHPKLAAICADLASQQPIRQIASKYGLSERSLYRYLRDLPKDVEKVRTDAEIERGERILELVVTLQDKLLAILEKAEKAGKDAVGISAIRACLENLTFHAKLVGKTVESPVQVNVALAEMPEWTHLKQVIFAALQPYKEAKVAVAAALLEEEHGLEAIALH
jgi:AcrR family transcriptional regulator